MLFDIDFGNELALKQMGTIFLVGELAKRVRHPLLQPTEKNVWMYVKTTMRMITILREAEEWTCVHLRESCLLLASAIMNSSLYVSQNYKAMHT